MPGFVLLVRDREDADPAMRVGFTVTRKIGGAVVRNRMKRRFRAIARAIVPAKGFPGADHVLMGTDYPFDMADYDPVGHVAEAALDAKTIAAICGGNAKKLLGL